MGAEAAKRYDVGRVTVDLAPHYRDATTYRWTDPDDSDHVLSAVRRPAAQPLDEWISMKRRGLRATLEGPLGGVATVPSARFPNRHFTFQSTELGNLVLHFAGLSVDAERVELSYIARARADATFAAIVQSLSLSPGETPPSPGSVRRPFEDFVLDVPIRLVPPTRFRFLNASGGWLVFDAAPFAPTADDFATELGAEGGVGLRVQDVPVRDLGWADLFARVRHYEVRLASEPRVQTFRLAYVSHSTDFLVSVFGYAPPEAGDIESEFRSVLFGMHRKVLP
jgi:hypothetical protein